MTRAKVRSQAVTHEKVRSRAVTHANVRSRAVTHIKDKVSYQKVLTTYDHIIVLNIGFICQPIN